MPGTDPVEATRIVRGELGEPNLPHLVELPARGVGSDATGRTAAMLEGLFADVQPHGWRLVDRPGKDHRRAVSALSTDLSVLADLIGESHAPAGAVKLQLRGPLTLAASVSLHSGERALSDVGARRDLADSLAAGAAGHIADVVRGTGCEAPVVVVEEPDAADVLTGSIPTASGYRTLRSIGRQETQRAWSTLVGALKAAGAGSVILAPGFRTGSGPGTARELFDDGAAAGFDGMYVSGAGLDVPAWERCAELVEQEGELWLGLLDPRRTIPGVKDAAERIRRPWRQLGLADARLGALTVLPDGGLADTSPDLVRQLVTRLTQTTDALNQLLSEV